MSRARPIEVARGGGTANARATVLGLGVNLIEVVHALARAGIRSDVVCPPGDPVRRSRHVDVLTTWPWSDEAAAAQEDVLEAVLLGAPLGDERPVLLVTCDEALLFASRHREALATRFRLPLGAPSLVEALTDKARFADLATTLDLPVPRTKVVPDPAEGVPDLAPLGYPLALKPYRRTPAWHAAIGGADKALRIDDEPALKEVWAGLESYGAPVLLQELVEGPESRIESYHCLVDGRGRTMAELTGRKLRTYPSTNGHTTSLVISDAHDVAALGRDVVARIGLTGIAKLDFKRDLDGRLHLLEVNARCHLWHHAAAVAGANLPALAATTDEVDLADGRLASASRSDPGSTGLPVVPTRTGVTWVHPRDLWSARAAGLSVRSWVRWARRADTTAFWAADDPWPLAIALAGAARAA